MNHPPLTEVKNPVTGAKMFCGYIRDMTEVNMYKKEKILQDKLIHSQFFQNEDNGEESGNANDRRRGARRLRKTQTAD